MVNKRHSIDNWVTNIIVFTYIWSYRLKTNPSNLIKKDSKAKYCQLIPSIASQFKYLFWISKKTIWIPTLIINIIFLMFFFLEWIIYLSFYSAFQKTYVLTYFLFISQFITETNWLISYKIRFLSLIEIIWLNLLVLFL